MSDPLEQQSAVIEASEGVNIQVIVRPAGAFTAPELVFERDGQRPRRGQGS
jgi:hypothetical protein